MASNLRPEDYRECVEGHGINPTVDIPLASLHGSCQYFTVPNGETAGIVGVADNRIWMLCTPAIHKYPLTFAREAKRYVEKLDKKFLWNIVDARNEVHIKLLKFLDFNLTGQVKYGPNNLNFILFTNDRTCSRSSPSGHGDHVSLRTTVT